MPQPLEPVLMTIPDFCAWARVSRSVVYREFAANALSKVKIGGRTYISVLDAKAWLGRHLHAQNPRHELICEIKA